MNGSSKAVLLIADISGYTKFMHDHAIATSHAKQIIVRLLKSLIHASRSPLIVAELEGDAVFFYALSSGKEITEIAQQVKGQILQFFSHFKREINQLSLMKTCGCDACIHVSDLRLKLVIHLGDVAIEKIERFEKLFGFDVILVHRMLKNSVPSHEYVMMTNPMYTSLVNFYGLKPERRTEKFEEVGEVRTLVFYPGRLVKNFETSRTPEGRPPLHMRLAWKLEIMYQTLLHLTGLRKIKGTFNNLPT